MTMYVGDDTFVISLQNSMISIVVIISISSRGHITCMQLNLARGGTEKCSNDYDINDCKVFICFMFEMVIEICFYTEMIVIQWMINKVSVLKMLQYVAKSIIVV